MITPYNIFSYKNTMKDSNYQHFESYINRVKKSNKNRIPLLDTRKYNDVELDDLLSYVEYLNEHRE